ncbi:MAG: hypothetical protein E7527_01740 [Ruminococcaceae bacterium]|nr:hypothetical protein [Oscillospiraceae bacterium]
MKQQKMVRLVESGLMLALSTVLSMVKVLELPYGGSITAFSALPLLLVAYRYGVKWGLFTAFAHALLQLVLGASVFSTPGLSATGTAAAVVLDYLLAFVVLGLGGVFRHRCRNQATALMWGAVLTGALRYICHVISGWAIWAPLFDMPASEALTYSLAYNATYMIPETIVTALGAFYLSRAVDLREQMPTRAKTAPVAPAAFWVGLAGKAVLLGAAVWSVVEIFAPLQDPETGDFVVRNLSLVAWPTVGIVLGVGLVCWLISDLLRRKLSR